MRVQMIRSIFGFLFKNRLTKWLEARKKEVRLEYEQKEQFLVSEISSKFDEKKKEMIERASELGRQDKDLADLERRVLDRKLELERVNEELKVQIRLIEAKASPDNVWTTAFSHGFSKAWDMMIRTMTHGIEKIKNSIKTQEIDASISRLSVMVEQRLSSIGDYDKIESFKLEEKKKEFINRRNISNNQKEKIEMDAYINLLNWLLGERNGN